MRIVIDMQGAQSESRFRGIGRYTLSFAQGIVRNRREHEVFLALSGLFPDTIEPIRAAFAGLLPQENIFVWYAPGPVAEGSPGNDARRELAELIREAFLASLLPDVIHISSLFEGYVDSAVTSIGRFDRSTPVSVSLYDLIPLLNPDQYLKPNPRYAQHYQRKIDHLGKATRLLAISDFTRQEGLAHLDLTANRVVNVSTATEPCFHPQDIDKTTAANLLHKFGLDRPFMLYTGGADDRKNLPRLIQAYAALPERLRASYQLLLAGRMPEGNIAAFKDIAKSAGLKPNELCFSGYVTDEELVQLYNLCHLFLFPSWHEGFGLPALEAMACGAPVIASNSSSLPEVIGLNEAMFDPLTVSGISAKMVQALQDGNFRTRLRENGLQQAHRFSWDKSSQIAIAAFEDLAKSKTAAHAASWSEASARLRGAYQQLIEAIAQPKAARDVLSDENLMEIARCIAANCVTTEYVTRSRKLSERITWRIEGPFDSSYSLALLNRETARAMDAMGHDVALHSTEGPGDFPANPEFLRCNPNISKLHARSLDISMVEADVTSRNLYPPRVADMNCRMNLLHHYAWEETGFPSDWVENFNEHLQGVTCLSRHVEKILIDNGVKVPISVSGCGVDHWDRVQADRNYRINGKSFRFLHVSSCFPRKGADVLLKAYGRAFQSRDDVTLVIKTFQNPHNDIHRWLAEVSAGNVNFPNVHIIEDDLTDGQLKSLYEQCQVMVAPSRAEGFGLPMAEAMLSGLAVITTGWGGQLDFCSDKTAWLVEYEFVPAKTHFGLFDSVWAEPNVEHLAETMHEVYSSPFTIRNERTEAGKKLLLEKFRWTHVAERLVNAARAWSQSPMPGGSRIGWVTSWNTRCGIATYSAHLVENIPTKITILAAKTNDLTQQDGAAVIRCWIPGEGDPLDELAKNIEVQQIDTLVIQFNYGFYNLERFGYFLNTQMDAGRTVVLTMHSTTDPVHAPHKRLEAIRIPLARCHRILVHAPHDLNRLKALGLVDNVALFPHGIRDYLPPLRTENYVGGLATHTNFTIASYGFFLPHKGLLELIEALALLRQWGCDVKLNMINAEYPVPESAALIQQAKAKVIALGLGDQVRMTTDFLADEASLALLSAADLIVFPYQNTGESSSAAVRYGLACGRPVAVTPLAIFDDVSAAVYKLPGMSSHEIAEGINLLIHALHRNELSASQIGGSSKEWRSGHLYSVIGPRLYNTLFALHTSAHLDDNLNTE